MTALIMPAYSFPRAMPTRLDGRQPFESAQFEPMYTQAMAPTRGSLIQVVNLAPDLWAMEFQTHAMSFEEAQEYLAWLQSLRGGARTFKAWHPLLQFPIAYPDGWDGLTLVGGSTPFEGIAQLTDIAETRDQVTIEGLPDGFQFTIGDMVSIELGATSRSLHRVMVEAVADNFGAADVIVEPTIPLSMGVSPPPEILLEKPYCLAVVDASSIRGPWQPGQLARVSFNATQTY